MVDPQVWRRFDARCSMSNWIAVGLGLWEERVVKNVDDDLLMRASSRLSLR